MSNSVEDSSSLLPGEGEVQTIVRKRVRHECEECGDPATKRHTYLLPNARRNPASRGYGKDDISRCEDGSPAYTCDAHERGAQKARDGYEWCGTYTLNSGNAHMFLHWIEKKKTDYYECGEGYAHPVGETCTGQCVLHG